MIYTNLNTNDFTKNLNIHFKNITNKKYIKETLLLHLKYKLITKKEYNELMKKYF